MINRYSTIGTVQLAIGLQGSQIRIRISPRHTHSIEEPNKGPAIIFFGRTEKESPIIIPVTKTFIVIHDSLLLQNLTAAAQQQVCVEILVRDNKNCLFAELDPEELLVEGAIIPATYNPKDDPGWGWGLGTFDSRKPVDVIGDAY